MYTSNMHYSLGITCDAVQCAIIYALTCVAGCILYIVHCERLIRRSFDSVRLLREKTIKLCGNDQRFDITSSAHQRIRELQRLAKIYNVTLLYANIGWGSEAIIYKNTIVLSVQLLATMIPINGKIIYPAHIATFFHELGHLQTTQSWTRYIPLCTIPFAPFLGEWTSYVYIFAVLSLAMRIVKHDEQVADLYMIDALQGDPEALTDWVNELRFISENDRGWMPNFTHPSVSERIGYVRGAKPHT